jgi:hypothetical protein
MKKEIEIRVRNESPSYSSETVVLIGGEKYKIVAENGNAYSRLNIYRYTKNGDLGLIACCYDIPNYKRVDYIWDDSRRLAGNRKNMEAAEEYIKKVF